MNKIIKYWREISLIFIGSVVWSLTMVRSGLLYSFGYGFWGANGHDGIFHLSLSKSLSNGSFDNPVFSGEVLKNYHFGFDLLLALLHKLTTIPVSNLYFQILPPMSAVLIGFLTYLFVKNWRKSRSEALWATAFIYFSGSLGFIFTFIKDGVFSGESMFWSQQSVSSLVNPPFALSLIFILSGLISLQKYQKNNNIFNFLLSTIFFGLLIQIKAYAAILVLGGLFVSGLYSYITNRDLKVFKIFVTSLIINLSFFWLVKNDGLSAFVWQPFWFLETMMSYSDRLGWERFYSAMTTYKMGHIWFKGVVAYLVAFLIFIVGNMGLRVIGLLHLTKTKIELFFVFTLSIVIASIAIPMLFVQTATPWNTIQFFYYGLFFFAIFAGIAMNKIKSKLKYLVFVIFAIFSSWATLQHYLPKMPQAIVSTDEVEALSFLEKQPNGVVLTYLFDTDKAKEAVKNPPRPLYYYDSTSYVSAYTNKEVFLEDEVNLNIMGYDWKKRRNDVSWFVSNLDTKKGKEFLTSNNIKYLYLVKENSPLQGELLKLGSTDLGLKKIFENKVSIIYEYGQDFSGN